MTEILTHIHTHTEGAFIGMYVFIVLFSTDSEARTIPGRLQSTVLTIIERCGT